MTVRLLEYTAPPPSGVTVTRNGYVDFQTRRDFKETGIGAYQVVPENEHDKGLYNPVTGEYEYTTTKVKTLPDKYMYDVHRRIAEYLNREDFREAVLEFANMYGCWFAADVISKNYTLHNIKEWRSEWEHVQHVVEVLGMYVQHPYLTAYETSHEEIEARLNQFANIAIGGDGKGRMAIRPMSIGGWVWGLIAKDYFDGITYTACPNSKCTREIPSVTPTTGKTLKYCSQSCKNAVLYLKNKKKVNDMPSLAEMAEAWNFTAFATEAIIDTRKENKEAEKVNDIPLLDEMAVAFEEFNAKAALKLFDAKQQDDETT